MKLLDVVHPAAKTLVDISLSQDAEVRKTNLVCADLLNTHTQVGDGTTTVVLLAGEILKNCKPFVEDGVHPQIIVRGLRKAGLTPHSTFGIFPRLRHAGRRPRKSRHPDSL